MTVSAPAFAQELTYGGISAYFSSYKDEVSAFGQTRDVTANANAFRGQAGVDFGAGVDGWFTGMTANFNTNLNSTDLKAEYMEFGLGYSFADAFRADVSLSRLRASAGFNLGFEAKEIGIAYDNGTYFARLSHSDLNMGNRVVKLENLTSIHAGYDANGIEAGVSVHWNNDEINIAGRSFEVLPDPVVIANVGYDAGNWEATLEGARLELVNQELSFVSLGGEYDFNDDWTAYGSISNAEAAGRDLDIYRLGGRYHLNERTSVFADVSQAKTKLGGLSVNATGIGFGLSVDMGDKPASYETTTDRLSGIIQNGLSLDY